MILDVRTFSDKGGRPNNEDYCAGNSSGEFSCFVLADGLGGHAGGEVASRVASEYILSAVEDCREMTDDDMLRLVNGANSAVVRYQDENFGFSSIRTTVVAALCTDRRFRYFNVGDSRLYYFRASEIIAQTKDHSVSQMAVDLGEITYDQIRTHSERNRLLKALGNDDDLRLKRTYDEIAVEPGDAFLLCSDGLWEWVYEKEMVSALNKADNAGEWCRRMLRLVKKRAPADNDNYSLICGMFIGERSC